MSRTVKKLIFFQDEPKNSNDQQNFYEIHRYSKRTHNFLRAEEVGNFGRWGVTEVQNWGGRLGRSSVLKLVYLAQKSEDTNVFWEILSRLKSRAKVPVYFCSIKTVSGSEQEEDWVSRCCFGQTSRFALENSEHFAGLEGFI